MKNYIVEETKYTPFIQLNVEDRVLEIKGKSYPENTFEFYKPLMNSLKEYFEAPSDNITLINIEIIYFNSSSSKFFFDLFDYIEEVQNKGFKIDIRWIYDEENESAQEAGEDFQEDFEELSFKLIEK